ncbi:MAG: 50S ribosomal protein L29 [Candidatus Levybacteria bacterium RIFCSPHIGHO2_01_FULL_36_15]|nr:MAG: 50S ribosomal protein L29 [Candidatus Levybacteria bacterium RIFCSPHIGHO2_01_FULL_36_15]OGH38361.1 MAG: 50S ribosomal protein L29 [Candidatus Levybacteria bacterium RIFCSPLOWO2_01_FULL_36_10]
MKAQELKDLSGKTTEELGKMLKDLKIEMAKLNMDLNLNKNKNVNILKTKKRDIARILTILKEKSA